MASLQKLDTVLYEVQQACIQMSLPPPVDVYGSADENALLMGSVANLAGIMVTDAHEWQSQRLPWVLVGDGIKTAWDLPANFSRLVDNTGWSQAIRAPVIVLNAQQWASIQAWVSNSFTVNPLCRIMGNQLVFLTAPAVGNISFEYIDSNWVIDQDDALILKDKATKSGDIPRYDWLLMMLAIKTKFLEQKGMNTVAAQSDFNERLAQLTQRDVMAQTLTLSGGVPGSFRFLDTLNLPSSGFGM